MKCMMEVIQKQCSLGGGEGKVLRMIGDREEEDRQREDEKKFTHLIQHQDQMRILQQLVLTYRREEL